MQRDIQDEIEVAEQYLEPCPEVKLYEAMVSRAIIDSHEWRKWTNPGRDEWWQYYFNVMHRDRIEVLCEWAGNDDAIPVNLVWIAQHIAGDRWEGFVETVRKAMSDESFVPDPRAFSFRLTYQQEQLWKDRREGKDQAYEQSRRQKRARYLTPRCPLLNSAPAK